MDSYNENIKLYEEEMKDKSIENIPVKYFSKYANNLNLNTVIKNIEGSKDLKTNTFDLLIIANTEFFYKIFTDLITTRIYESYSNESFLKLLDYLLNNYEIDTPTLLKISYSLLRLKPNPELDKLILKIANLAADRNEFHLSLDLISRVYSCNRILHIEVSKILTVIGANNEHLMLRFLINNCIGLNIKST